MHIFDAFQAAHRATLRRLLVNRFGAYGTNTRWDPVTSRLTQPQNIYLGSEVFIGPYAIISAAETVRIGSDSIIGPGLMIMTGNHRFYEAGKCYRDLPEGDNAPVTVGRNVWIGARVTILGGVTIGDGAVVGAGAVVTRDLPPFSIAAGVPARPVRRRFDENGERMHRSMLRTLDSS